MRRWVIWPCAALLVATGSSKAPVSAALTVMRPGPVRSTEVASEPTPRAEPQKPLRALDPSRGDNPKPPAIRAPPSGIRDADVARLFEHEPSALGSMSWGRPQRGLLVNGTRMPEGPSWRIIDASRAWGTDETIASIVTAITSVSSSFPDSPPLYVGNISAEHGGHLRPHHSHQSGRDADLGYYYLRGPGWYKRATAKNLDRARTWALAKAFATDPNVEAIFMDRSVQRLLREYAASAGEDPAWLDAIFKGGLHGTSKLIFHAWGHATHLHVRFRSPVARATAALAEGPIEAMRRGEQTRRFRARRR